MKKQKVDEDDYIDEIKDRISMLKNNINKIKWNIQNETEPLVLKVSIEKYVANKSKTMKLIKAGKLSCVTNKQKLEVIKGQEKDVENMCQDFEDQHDFSTLKESLASKDSQAVMNIDDVEKMLGEMRDAALKIKKENRMNQREVSYHRLCDYLKGRKGYLCLFQNQIIVLIIHYLRL